MILKIEVSDKLYETLKKHNLLKGAKAAAIEGLVNSIILKIDEDKPRRFIPSSVIDR